VLTEKSIMPATLVQLHQLWTIEVVAADGAEISLAGQTSDVSKNNRTATGFLSLIIHSVVKVFSL
jgi:hypothetical protein